MRKLCLLLFFLNVSFNYVNSYVHLDWEAQNQPFDQSFYDQHLDSELCSEQLAIIRNDTRLALQFIEAGIRIPRSILEGNLVDLGNYFQCIKIDEEKNDFNVQGKYCMLDVPINQELQLPQLPSLPELPEIEWPEWLPEIDFNPAKLRIGAEEVEVLQRARRIETIVRSLTNGQISNERSLDGTGFENLQFRLAVCIPKVCTTKEWMEGFIFNISSIGLQYDEHFCRIKDDKPWVAADYVAIVVFLILCCLTLLSTCYDIWHTCVRKSDPKHISPLRTAFSLYTNGRRLTTFSKNPSALECVDGIRAISMAWVILGHTFSTLPNRVNVLDAVNWTLSFESLWVTAAPICVDTFFMLSGLLLVYTTCGKLTSMKLLQNLHLFYLNRLLRMFPILAAGVLLQASFMFRMYDGPIWINPANLTRSCRIYWWSTLLYIQNYLNSWNMCLPHTWYLAIDVQLHILSPLVLYWVLSGKKTAAWISMSATLLAVLAASTAYIFVKEFPGAVLTATRGDEYQDYMMYYYFNTLTRAAPFFVGMLFGYLLHIYRGKKLHMAKATTVILWMCALGMMWVGIYSSHPMKNADWDNQTVDSLFNAFARPIWAAGVAWVIFACHHGYGGPINWFLSLQAWKLLSRVSYAMYIFHYPLMYISTGTALQPIYYSQMRAVYRFFSEFTVAFLVAFSVTIFVDSPFSTILKLVLGGGPKKPSAEPNNAKNGKVGIDAHLDRNNNMEKEKYNIKL